MSLWFSCFKDSGACFCIACVVLRCLWVYENLFELSCSDGPFLKLDVMMAGRFLFQLTFLVLAIIILHIEHHYVHI